MPRHLLLISLALAAVLAAGVAILLGLGGGPEPTPLAGLKQPEPEGTGAAVATRPSGEIAPRPRPLADPQMPGQPPQQDPVDPGRTAQAEPEDSLHLQGTVRDAISGGPLSTCLLRVRTSEQDGAPDQPIPESWKLGRSLITTAGRFRSELPFLQIGQAYRIEIEAEGYRPFVLPRWRPSDPRAAIEADLYPSASLEGRLVWADTGEPVAGGSVRVLSAINPKLPITAETRSDEQGYFRLQTVSDLALTLIIEEAESLPIQKGPLVLARTVPLALGEIRLQPAARLTVTVLDGELQPAADLAVHVRITTSEDTPDSALFEATQKTDEKGQATFGKVPPGTVFLSVQDQAGDQRSMRPTRLPARRHPNLVVHLGTRTCDLKGSVTTSRPIQGAIKLQLLARLGAEDYVPMATQEVQAGASYGFLDLTPGIYRLEGTVEVDGRSFTGSREFDLKRGHPPVHLRIQIKI